MDELVEIVRELGVRGEQERDEQWPRLAVQQRSGAVVLILGRVRLSALEFECAQRSRD